MLSDRTANNLALIHIIALLKSNLKNCIAIGRLSLAAFTEMNLDVNLGCGQTA